MLEGISFPYSYKSSGWRDQLFEYNGQKFVYDKLGNPTSYKNQTLVWSHGRQLDSFGNVATYKYNACGLRISKTFDNFETKFFLNGSKIISQQDALNTLTFYYGADEVTGFHLKNNVVDADYFYKKNAQNDIVGIYSTEGKQIARYSYDAWGNQKVEYLNNSGEFVAIEKDFEYNNTSDINRFIAYKNPFRYRSYYYDFETGLYYLNSRYYDPEICRFINADNIGNIDATQVVINGLNLYAYCLNNPVNTSDENGDIPKWLKWIFKALAIVATVVVCVAAATVTAGAGLGIIGAALTTGFIGAAASMTGQLISDIGTSIVTGDWYMSSFNDYFGAALGGFVGGTIAGASGNFALGFGFADGISSTIVSILNGENVGEALLKGIGSFIIGYTMGSLFGGTKLSGITKGRGSNFAVFKAGLTKMIKYFSKMSSKVVLKGYVALTVFKYAGNFLKGILHGILNRIDFSKQFSAYV